MRAQSSLPAFGLSLVLLTAVTVLGVAVADGAFGAADRSPIERQTAVGLSDRLVATSSPLTVRANVLNASALDRLNTTTLRDRYGLSRRVEARISLEGTPVVSTGDVDGGTTIERLVILERRTERTVTPSFTGGNTVTLPRRTPTATLRIDPDPNVTVMTVRANERVVLHNRSGLAGTHHLSLSVFQTVEFQFEATRQLSAGAVEITYRPADTRRAGLAVTVDG